MTRKSIVHSIGLTALVAVGTSVCIGLGSPAHAAQNNNTVRSNRSEGAAATESASGSGGGAGKASFQDLHITEQEEGFGKDLDTMEALLATLTEQLSQLQALSTEIQTLGQEVQDAETQNAEEGADHVARLEDAKKAFDEQVAGELDSDVADAVTASLDAAHAEASDQADAAQDATLPEQIEALNQTIADLQAALDEMKALQSAVKASWNLKENVK